MLTTEPLTVLETSFLAGAMNEAAAEVFTTMLNHTAEQSPPEVRQSIEVINDGVVSLIGLTGDWVGSGVLSCSSDCARWMSSQFLMSGYEEVNDEVLDAIGQVMSVYEHAFHARPFTIAQPQLQQWRAVNRHQALRDC